MILMQLAMAPKARQGAKSGTAMKTKGAPLLQ